MTITTDVTLEDVRQRASRLSQIDQLRLISYLTTQMTTHTKDPMPEQVVSLDEAQRSPEWKRFLEIGNNLAASDSSAFPSLTEIVLADRR